MPVLILWFTGILFQGALPSHRLIDTLPSILTASPTFRFCHITVCLSLKLYLKEEMWYVR